MLCFCYKWNNNHDFISPCGSTHKSGNFFLACENGSLLPISIHVSLGETFARKAKLEDTTKQLVWNTNDKMDQVLENGNGNNTVLVADSSMEAPREHFSPTDTNSLPRVNRVIHEIYSASHFQLWPVALSLKEISSCFYKRNGVLKSASESLENLRYLGTHMIFISPRFKWKTTVEILKLNLRWCVDEPKNSVWGLCNSGFNFLYMYYFTVGDFDFHEIRQFNIIDYT